MKEDAIQVLKVEPGKAPKVVTIPNTLEAMQQMVGGYIEVIPLDDVCLVCNEEGKLMGLPGSRRLGNDVIAGHSSWPGIPRTVTSVPSLRSRQTAGAGISLKRRPSSPAK